MNKFLSIMLGIGRVAEAVAVETIPAAGPIDAGVHQIINAKNTDDKELAIFNTSLAAVDAVDNFDPKLIEDHFTDIVAAKDDITAIHAHATHLRSLIK